MDEAQLNKLQNTINKKLSDEDIKTFEEVEGSVKKLLRLCGDDPERDGLQETPFRVVKSFMERTIGYDEDPSKHLEKTFDVDFDDMIVINNIEFHSMCEHHLVNFNGIVHIGYIPNEKTAGLSKFARVVEGYSKRFQVQERLTEDIKQAIVKELDPKGVIVYANAAHFCMHSRGVEKPGSKTATISTHGEFKEYEAQNKFFQMIQLKGREF